MSEAGTSGAPAHGAHGYLRLVLLGALVGIPAAFVAALFLALTHDLQHWLWTDLPDTLGEASPPWYLVLGLPVVGASIVVLARVFLPGDGGHKPLDGLGGGPAPLTYAPGIALAALGTLGFGAVLGPEAPIIALGSLAALATTATFRLGQKETLALSGAGSFSAISALFGGPIVGGVMMVESSIGLGAGVIPALLPGFVTAAVGYVIFLGFGSWGGLDAQGLAVPNLPAYTGTHLRDLALAAAIGVVTAVIVVAVRRGALAVAGREERIGVPMLLLVGGAAVGALALVADVLGADSQDVLFSGQASIPTLVEETSTSVLVVLLGAKAIAYAISLACGFRGGPIFPAVFLGIGVATLPVVWFGVSPTFAVAVGAAAGMAAQSRLILTSMLFAALLVGTRGFDTISATVLAAAAAWLTVTELDRRRPSRGTATA